MPPHLIRHAPFLTATSSSSQTTHVGSPLLKSDVAGISSVILAPLNGRDKGGGGAEHPALKNP